MKDETKNWIAYAGENLHSAVILLESGLLNPCLHNIQQSVEKYLKALLLEKDQKIRSEVYCQILTQMILSAKTV